MSPSYDVRPRKLAIAPTLLGKTGEGRNTDRPPHLLVELRHKTKRLKKDFGYRRVEGEGGGPTGAIDRESSKFTFSWTVAYRNDWPVRSYNAGLRCQLNEEEAQLCQLT